MEGLNFSDILGNLGSILGGDTIGLALKLALVIGIPTVIGIILFIVKKRAESAKREEDEKKAEDQEKKDSNTTIDENKKDSSDAGSDKASSEKDRHDLQNKLDPRR
jgi:type III secretory pathway component EscV